MSIMESKDEMNASWVIPITTEINGVKTKGLFEIQGRVLMIDTLLKNGFVEVTDPYDQPMMLYILEKRGAYENKN